MALINITVVRRITTVQYLCLTSLTVRLQNVGPDRAVQQATRRVRPVMPSAHFASSPLLCSCHQPWNPSPLGLTANHSDNQDRAVEAVWPQRSLWPGWGPRTPSQRRHRRTAKGLMESRLSSTNVATHRRARPPATKHRAVGGQELCTRPSSLATSGGDGYLQHGACSVIMMMR